MYVTHKIVNSCGKEQASMKMIYPVVFFILTLHVCSVVGIQYSMSPNDILLAKQLSVDVEFKTTLPQNLTQQIIEAFKLSNKSEDIHLNIEQLITKYGFQVERHQVQTEDGYLLSMFRIPGRKQRAVFLMHGLLNSADEWVTPGPSHGIAYFLAREGYDVWMGNSRGNKHSRKHVHLPSDSEKFWDFSWDEIGRYDLPAMVDYVLNATNQAQLPYVGHSQGTTAFFVFCSERPEYNSKISIMVALSAVAWMSHIRSPIVKLLSPINPLLHFTLQMFGINEFSPSIPFVQLLMKAVCGTEVLAELVCSNVLFLMGGFDHDQINVSNLPVMFSHVIGGAATKQLVHYAQGVVSGKFQRFDYGPIKNIKLYKAKQPPNYEVQRITAPVAIMYSENDWLADIRDVETLRNLLKNVVDFYKVPFKKFNHMDYLWAKDLDKLVIPKLLELLRKTH